MKSKKRWISVLLSVCLLLTMIPVSGITAFAADGITYLTYENGNWQTKTQNGCTEVTNSDAVWNSGWYVVNGEVSLGSRVTVRGDVHLILADRCTLNANSYNIIGGSGIDVAKGNSLTIYAQSTGDAMGILFAVDRSGCAGIGGGWNSAGGTVTVNGGKVTATSESIAAGIGGGFQGAGGTVTVNGGTVTATGGSNAAGIGGGKNGAGGTVTVNGGTVNATGEFNAAGIGGGVEGAGGTVTVNGGTVTATGGEYAAGIGGGYKGAGGTVTVNGGTVTAIGGQDGAGIGVGDMGLGGSFITTSAAEEPGNAVIFASSISDQSNKENWHGIIFEGNSGQFYGKTVTPTDDFTIGEDKTLTVPSGSTLVIPDCVTVTNNGEIIVKIGGAITNNDAITGNPAKYETNYLDKDGNQQTTYATFLTSATKTLGKADAESWYVVQGKVDYGDNTRITVIGNVHLILADGCGLIAWDGGIDVSLGNSLTIYAQSTGGSMGTLYSTGKRNGAGIGSGTGVACGNITINGGKITANGGYYAAGIGDSAGIQASESSITINGGDITAIGGHRGAGIGSGFRRPSGNITINGGTVNATGGQSSAGIGGGAAAAGGTITINGGRVTAKATEFAAAIGGGQEGSGGTVTINSGTVIADIQSPYFGIGCGVKGESGTFSTGDSGNAVIFTNIISDQSGKADWSGVIFEGDSGQVYGDTVTPTEDFAIPEGKTLTVPSDSELVITEDIAVTNNGAIKVDGVLDESSAWEIDGNKPMYKILVYGGTSNATDGYAAEGDKITLTPSEALAGMEVFWTIYGEDAQIIDSTFTMPAKALEIMVNVSNEPDDDENNDPTGSDSIYGDIDGDGAITVTDVTLIQKFSIGLDISANVTDKVDVTKAADVNGDGIVSVLDATMAQKYIANVGGNTGLVGKEIK